MHKDYIDDLTKKTILSDETYSMLFGIDELVAKTQFLAALRIKARELKVLREFDMLLKTWQTKLAQAQKRGNSQTIQFTDGPFPGLKCGDWIADDTGVYKLEEKDFRPYKVFACPHPIQPIERLVNLDTDTEKITLSFFKDQQWQKITVDRLSISDKGLITKALANRGIEVNSKTGPHLMEYISDVVNLNLQELPIYKSISRLGWIEAEFAPYDKGIKYDGDQDFLSLYDKVQMKGNYAKWIEFVSDLRQRSICLRLQMAASFASPLIEKLNILPFVFHLWGGTGTGKTVGLMVAMSIWGNPSLGGLVRTMNMTANSMARTAAFLHNLPFAGDELQTIKNKWRNYDDLIMFITEGMDRGRARQYGGIEQLKTWKCSFLFTGEEPITKADSGGGAKNRVIEAEVSDIVIEDGHKVVNFITKHYGHAGFMFVKALPAEPLQARYTELFDQILKARKTTEKQAMAMAVMLLADEIAVKYIFTDEKPLTVNDIKEFLTDLNEVDVANRAYDWSINWISRNIERFKGDDNKGEVWGKIDKNTALINRDVYREKLNEAGFDYQAVIGKFAKRELIERTPQGKSVHSTHINGHRSMVVKLSLNDLTTDMMDEIPF